MSGLQGDAVYEDETGRRYTGAVLMNMGIWVSLREDFSSCVKIFRRVADCSEER